MADHCPTCGRPLPQKPKDKDIVTDAAALLAILRSRGDMQVYRGHNTHRWFITYRGGEVDADLVRELASKRVLRQCYSDHSDAYGLEPTIDMEATLERRRQTGDRHLLVYAA